MIISADDRSRVEAAIKDAEQTTSGEIVVVIARASGAYYYAAFLWAALVALLMPWPFIYWTWWRIQDIYALQLLIFGVLVAIFLQPALRFRLVPVKVKRRMAHRRAVEQFLAQNLHTKPGHTGVLLFISEAERYVEVLADTAVHEKVPEGEWKDIVNALTAKITAGEAASGLIEAVKRVGAHLAAHFPPRQQAHDMLPNHLIVLNTM